MLDAKARDYGDRAQAECVRKTGRIAIRSEFRN